MFLEFELEDDFVEVFGWIALILFGLAILYVIIFQINMNARRLFPKGSDRNDLKVKQINGFFAKIKKPLSYIHYFGGLIAVGFILIHGVSLISEDLDRVLFGLIAALAYTFYLISGILIKGNFAVLSKSRLNKKVLFKIHSNILLILIILVSHMIHLWLALK